jgi:hypothetical protein
MNPLQDYSDIARLTPNIPFTLMRLYKLGFLNTDDIYSIGEPDKNKYDVPKFPP